MTNSGYKQVDIKSIPPAEVGTPPAPGPSEPHSPILLSASARQKPPFPAALAAHTELGSGLRGSALCACGLDLLDAEFEAHGDFSGSSFEASRLVYAIVLGCTLREVSFRRASLQKMRFVSCDLRGADFGQTLLAGASFVRCDMRGARGLRYAEELGGIRVVESRLSRESRVLLELSEAEVEECGE